MPVALNSGLHWGRKAFVKKPGVITIEFLPAIQPGMKSREFLALLEERIETASNALLQQVPRAIIRNDFTPMPLYPWVSTLSAVPPSAAVPDN